MRTVGYTGLLTMNPGSPVVLPDWVILVGKGSGSGCLQSFDVF